jgi:uncharacterized protein (DUF2384 family)
MNKRELAKAVALQADIELNTVTAVLDGFTDVVTTVVSKGEQISIPGFDKLVKVNTSEALAAARATDVFGSQSGLASWIGVSRSQPGKWISGTERPSSRAASLNLDLAYVAERALGVWGTLDAVREWLWGHEPILDDARPLDVLKAEGPKRLIEALDAQLAGSFV